MTILYISSINNPLNKPVNALPPSVFESEWYTTFTAAIENQEIVPDIHVNNGTGPGIVAIKFSNQFEYTAWVEKYKLIDKTLIDDIIVWNNTHGLIHTYEVQSDDETSVPLLKLIPLD